MYKTKTKEAEWNHQSHFSSLYLNLSSFLDSRQRRNTKRMVLKKNSQRYSTEKIYDVCVCVCCWGLQSAYLSSESEQIPVMCWQNGKHMTITPFSWPFHANQRYYRLVMCFNLLSSAFNMHILWFFFFFFFWEERRKNVIRKPPQKSLEKTIKPMQQLWNYWALASNFSNETIHFCR